MWYLWWRQLDVSHGESLQPFQPGQFDIWYGYFKKYYLTFFTISHNKILLFQSIMRKDWRWKKMKFCRVGWCDFFSSLKGYNYVHTMPTGAREIVVKQHGVVSGLDEDGNFLGNNQSVIQFKILNADCRCWMCCIIWKL